MKAVEVVEESGKPKPQLVEVADPRPARGEVLVDVQATALNHADLLQIRGQYPPPAGESTVPGLECSGLIAELGAGVSGFLPGDRVMALLGGGGHASRVAIPVGQLMALPDRLSFAEGAALPEACLTAWTNLVHEGGLRPGETVLVTGATGGMGTMAVEIANQLGARVLAAGRDRGRLENLRGLGADGYVLLDETLTAEALALTGGRGVDLIFDLVGGRFLPDLIRSLAVGGRLTQVGLLAGRSAQLELYDLMSRRARLIGSVLRPRSRTEKAALVRGFAAFGLPRLADGRLRPVVDRIMPFERIIEAYGVLAAGGVSGKIVLTLES
ncbi:MAG: NAD(P)H-quinone oxidoreductase [Acidobacteriota bacterium]